MITGGQPCFLAAFLVALLSADSPFEEAPTKIIELLIHGRFEGVDVDGLDAKRADRKTESPGEASL